MWRGREDHVYLNTEGVLDSIPDWTSDSAHQTLGVALADIDGNGQLDLICANLNQPTPSTTAGATHSSRRRRRGSQRRRTRARTSTWPTSDSDGDLDLVFANRAQPSTLYVNNLKDPGALARRDPDWSTSRADRTIAIASLGRRRR